MQLFLKIPPAEEPLSLTEVKTYLRVTSDLEDSYIRDLIASARAYVEGVTGRALLKQKWLMQLNPPYPRTSPLIKWKGKDLEIMIPHQPLMEVKSTTIEGKELPFKVRENKIGAVLDNT
ncbi:MAG: phage head-tail connector protein, partial [Proteobacteria bacterium]|nr:phage head-tail connector protein [Pseudomonadota bacterium]